MRIAYIAHPISGDIPGNLEKIRQIARQINMTEPGVVAFAPYWLDCHALDDNNPEERERGIRNNTALLKRGFVTELRVYGDRISAGMRAEINLANDLGIPVYYHNHSITKKPTMGDKKDLRDGAILDTHRIVLHMEQKIDNFLSGRTTGTASRPEHHRQMEQELIGSEIKRCQEAKAAAELRLEQAIHSNNTLEIQNADLRRRLQEHEGPIRHRNSAIKTVAERESALSLLFEKPGQEDALVVFTNKWGKHMSLRFRNAKHEHETFIFDEGQLNALRDFFNNNPNQQ